MNENLINFIKNDFKKIKLENNDIMTLVTISLKFFEKEDYVESSSILIDIYKKTENKSIENLAKKVVFIKIINEYKEKIEVNFNDNNEIKKIPSWLIFENLVFTDDQTINKAETEVIIENYIKDMIIKNYN